MESGFQKKPHNEIRSIEDVPRQLIDTLSPEQVGEFRKLKWELRDILTPAGVWSDVFENGLKENMENFSTLANMIQQYVKARSLTSEAKRNEELGKRRRVMERNLSSRGLWPDSFANWLENGTLDSLNRVSEILDCMDALFQSSTVPRIVEQLRKGASLVRKKSGGRQS